MIEGHIEIDVPAGVPVWDVDPYDTAVLSDPEDYYAELRSKGPFAYISRYSMLALHRYAHIFQEAQRETAKKMGQILTG